MPKTYDLIQLNMSSFYRIITLAVVIYHATLVFNLPVDNSENAYSGKGGHASGGNVTHSDGKDKGFLGLGPLINYNSGNAGKGGAADSGGAIGGLGEMLSPKFGRWAGGSNSGNAYSQDGGVADGGSVHGTNDALINWNSNNAGHGGEASSGKAVGGGGSSQDKQKGDHDYKGSYDHKGDYRHKDYDHEGDYGASHEDNYGNNDHDDKYDSGYDGGYDDDKYKREGKPDGEDCDC
ncbi:hypothetical protein H0H93_014433 [Arthromyces matolae]|nr:hypothetical protein H0H93_014433 [Arthromyces matolae]